MKSGKLIFNDDQPFSNYQKGNDTHRKKYGKEKQYEEKMQIEPRQRKAQRSLRNVDQFLDNVDKSKKPNILKLRYEKETKDLILKKIEQPFDENKVKSNEENKISLKKVMQLPINLSQSKRSEQGIFHNPVSHRLKPNNPWH